MKSMYIIAGGILVMAAVVFLAPQKQNNTEEKASSQLDEIAAFILKEYGTVWEKLSPEEKELGRQEIAEFLAREKAEIKKYGRILTDEERYQLEWQAEVKARQEAEFAELYAEQKDWIGNFPFRQEGYHQSIVFDPENIAHSDEKYRAYQKELERKSDEAMDRYNTEVDKLWARTDLTREEKHAEDDKLFRAVELAAQKYHNGDSEIEEQRRILM